MLSLVSPLDECEVEILGFDEAKILKDTGTDNSKCSVTLLISICTLSKIGAGIKDYFG